MVEMYADITKQEHLVDDIFSMILRCPAISEVAHSGQFVSVYSKDSARLLPRPISICEVDKKAGTIRLVYRTVGAGTTEFSGYKKGDSLKVVGPIGNGYELNSSHPILMGGGIGIPPMLELAKEFSAKGLSKNDISVILGYRDNTFLLNEFKKIATVYISSDSGSVGTKGTVIDAAKENVVTGDAIYACGPKPMLKAIKAYAYEKDVPAFISLEERMACGIGACLACVCKSVDVDDHSKVNNKRICVDGPVFNAEEVEL
ncbi:MAG: dihydroorotate dehydrogenase electron transfer subunit [Eubacterium sp.]|nr:dihydroorotate dehydrogenase electron transfer subunit [Eubacterium sp.]